MNKLLSLSALVVLASTAAASAAVPAITATTTDIGGGLYSTIFSVSDNAATGSWAVDITVTGTSGAVINESLKGTTKVTKQSFADAFDGISGYSAAVDTYVLDNDAFTSVTTATESTNSFRVLAGTTSGLKLGASDFLKVVSTTGKLSYTGTVGRSGNTYSVASSVDVPVITPEPASLGLLGLGAVALLRRRK